MFGANVLIRDYREGGDDGKRSGKKSDSLVRVYRAENILRDFGLDRQGLILFALLSGGDYDTKGLENCGPKAALAAAQYENGYLGRVLYDTPLPQLHQFADCLRQHFRQSSRPIYVPPGYPRDLHVKNYREPKVSTPEQARSLRGLSRGWDVSVDETRLRTFLLEKFNFQTKDYIKHVLPVLTTKALAATPPDCVQKNLDYNIKLVIKRKEDPHAPVTERKITFSPAHATTLDLRKQPGIEEWIMNEDGTIFDPELPVETELLDCVLHKGLGATEMQRLKDIASRPQPRGRKRKAQDVSGDPISSTKASANTMPIDVPETATKKSRMKDAKTTKPAVEKEKKKRKTKKEKEKEAEAAAAAAIAAAVPPATFRLPSSLKRYGSDPSLSSQNSFGTSSKSSQPMHPALTPLEHAVQPDSSLQVRSNARMPGGIQNKRVVPRPLSPVLYDTPTGHNAVLKQRSESTMPLTNVKNTSNANNDINLSAGLAPAKKDSSGPGAKSREEIAAARLRHFERDAEVTVEKVPYTDTTLKSKRPVGAKVSSDGAWKVVPETIDLTLDD